MCIAIFASLNKEITTESQMRPECPSCEVIEILGCLYRKRKKKKEKKCRKRQEI
jgi:hypothetical protein